MKQTKLWMQLTNSTAEMNEEIRDRRNTIQEQTKIKEMKYKSNYGT